MYNYDPVQNHANEVKPIYVKMGIGVAQKFLPPSDTTHLLPKSGEDVLDHQEDVLVLGSLSKAIGAAPTDHHQ